MNQKYLKTAEFAEFCGTTKDTLIWYDRKGLLKPVFTGSNGYRYYTPSQLFDYSMISTLKQAGSSLKEISELPYRNRQDMITLMEERSEELSRMQEELQRMREVIESILTSFHLAEENAPGMPRLVELEPVWLAVTELPEGVGWFESSAAEYMYQHIRTVQKSPGVHLYPQGTILRADALKAGKNKGPVELAYFREAEPGALPALRQRPAGTYVQILHSGEYDRISDTLEIARKYLEKNRLCAAGDIYEYDLVTFLTADPKDFSQLLLIPVKPAD